MDSIIAVVITYNIGKRFEKSIEALKNKVKEIVVVDNGSDEETIKLLKSMEDDITLIELGCNKGIAYALNRGIEYGIKKKCKWILTLDHDSIISSSMLENMLKVYDKIDHLVQEKIAMITPIHIEENLYDSEKNTEDNWKEVLTEITSGALVKTEVYRDFSLYSEELFIDLVDHEYCLKLNENGYKVIQVDSAILLHNLGESETKSILGIKITPTNHSAVRRYYMTRNRLYIWEKYKGKFSKWIFQDKKKFVSEIIKIIIFENDKKEKLRMIIEGRKDYKKKKFYKYG